MNLEIRAAFGPGQTPAADVPADGLFPRTALPVRQGVPCHLEAHLDRLRAGAAAMGHALPWLSQAGLDLAQWLAQAPPGEAALRLALHLDLQSLVARLGSLPPSPSRWRLIPLAHPMGDLRAHPLARHKGLSGPWRPGVLAEAHHRGAEDALLLWPDGTLAETAIAVAGLEREGVLNLPPAAGRVASLAERLELPAWAQARGWTLRWAPITLADCGTGRLWCFNALRGLWPATLS